MSGLWIAAFAALTLLVLLLAVVQVGLLRRVTAVLERAEAAVRDGGSAAGDGLAPGARIQPFVAASLQGRPVRSDEVRGESIWLLLSAGCGPCQLLAADLRRAPDGAGLGMPLRVLLDSHDDARELDLPAWIQVLVAGEQAAARSFRTSGTPHAFAANDGVVTAQTIPNRVADLRRLAARARGEPDQPPLEPPPDLELLLDHHHEQHHERHHAHHPPPGTRTDVT
jgi:hypothetical protein